MFACLPHTYVPPTRKDAAFLSLHALSNSEVDATKFEIRRVQYALPRISTDRSTYHPILHCAPACHGPPPNQGINWLIYHS